jgi:hypothetical protein
LLGFSRTASKLRLSGARFSQRSKYQAGERIGGEMLWRFLSWIWNYAIGELLIVTAGVLIALGANQWNIDRLDRAEEVLIIERLISDLESDLGNLGEASNGLEEKRESLQRIYSILVSPNPKPDDPAEFLGDIIVGANYGWNQPVARRITFDELLSSGKFRLIRKPKLREMIAAYYSADQDAHNRIEERETDFPKLSYQLVRRGSELELIPNFTMLEAKQMTARVVDAALLNHVTAELNFARFADTMFDDLIRERNKLYGELEAYLDAIQ